VPAPVDTTANGSTTTTNATDAIEASTFQAMFNRSTHPEGHKRHCRRNSTVRRAEFRAWPDSVRCYPRTLWETMSEQFGRQSLSVLICFYGQTSPFVQSVGGVC
jgi:hypothetical protein